jgi:hypothetical protein
MIVMVGKYSKVQIIISYEIGPRTVVLFLIFIIESR